MKRHLILANLLFILVGNAIAFFGHFDDSQQWNLWFVYLGMGLMIAVDAIADVIRRRGARVTRNDAASR